MAVVAENRKRSDGFAPRRWTREEYHRAADLGLFRPDERLELLGGEIIRKMPPQKAPHFTVVELGAEALERAFGPGFHARRQGPFVLSEDSEPEPDIAIVAGSRRDFAARHPEAAEIRLLVEVSDATLRLDRGRKAALYASVGIRDYWLVDLNARTLEVRRDPAPASGRTRAAYRSIAVFRETERVAPLHAPAAPVLVSDLLPPPSGGTTSR